MKTSSTSKLLAALVQALSTATTFAAFSGSDNFNDNSKDPSKWGTDIFGGGGTLTETSQVLQYTTTGVPSGASVFRPWIANTGSYTSNWTLQIDVNLPTLTAAPDYLFGVVVRNGDDVTDSFNTSLEVFNPSGTPNRHFLSAYDIDGVAQPEVNSSTSSTSVSVRIRYDAATTTLFSEFDADGAVGGYSFTNFDSRNISSTWNMSASSVFQAGIAAGSGSRAISASDNVSGDNFVATPEPSSILLLLSGAALCLRRRSLRTNERCA